MGRVTSIVTVGLIAGVAEAAAAVTKPIFPLASSVSWVFGARFIDRVGKGIRGAPRDALVADITPPSMRGAAYRLRQALDSAGAVLGTNFPPCGMFGSPTTGFMDFADRAANRQPHVLCERAEVRID